MNTSKTWITKLLIVVVLVNVLYRVINQISGVRVSQEAIMVIYEMKCGLFAIWLLSIKVCEAKDFTELCKILGEAQ